MSGKRFACASCMLLVMAMSASVGIVLIEDASPTGEVEVVVLAMGPEARQQAAIRGAQAAAEELGVALTIGRAPSRGKVEPAAWRAPAANAVRGAVVYYGPSDARLGSIQGLGPRGLVVTCGEDRGPASRICHVGTSAYGAGLACSKLIKETDSAGGRIIAVVDLGDEQGAKRLIGFIQAIKQWDPLKGGRPDMYTVTEYIVDRAELESRGQSLGDAVGRIGAADWVLDFSDSPTTDDLAALTAVARQRNAKLVTVDGSDEAITAVESGDVFAVLAVNPYLQGYEAVVRLVRICRANELSQPVLGRGGANVPVTVVRQGSVAEFRAQVLNDARPSA